MTWLVIWQEDVANAVVAFLQDDPIGLADLLGHLDDLEHDARPPHSSELGSADLRRLRVGRYRVMYEIVTAGGVINVIHIGRVP